jgi:hypothetical protein
MRVGQKNKLTYLWARKGSRPRAMHDQRTQSTLLFGAVCPELETGVALVLPACNAEAMQLHLEEIAKRVTPGAHALLILDRRPTARSPRSWAPTSAESQAQQAARVRVKGSPTRRNRIVLRRQRRDGFHQQI